MQPNTEAKFWTKVQQSEPEECWPWTASRNKGNEGYGQFRFGGKYWTAHRLAWLFTHGEIPEGMFICHTCDNPGCCNPGHLFMGTPRDNMLDMHRKGRNAKIHKKKPCCKNGHPFTPENTGRREKGKRVCRACAAAGHARWKIRYPERFAAYRAALNVARRTGRPGGRPAGIKELRPRRRKGACV